MKSWVRYIERCTVESVLQLVKTKILANEILKYIVHTTVFETIDIDTLLHSVFSV